MNLMVMHDDLNAFSDSITRTVSVSFSSYHCCTFKQTVMKKLFFTSAFALFVSLSFSQTIIPKAGITLSKWAGEDVSGADSKLGFTLGLGFNFPVGTGPISIQPELNFAQKGFKASEDNETAKMTTSYLEVPVLIKATFGEATKFYLNAGPSLGIGLGGKLKVKSGSVEESVDVKFGDPKQEDVWYIEKRTDFGLQLGGGVLIAEKVMIDLRYGLGLSTMYEDAKIKNNVFQFTIGVPLSLGK